MKHLIAIQTGEMIAGDLPISVLRKINQWIRDQQIKNWLIENFFALNPRLRK
jgi:cytochrome c-type biogenesis protein CcmH/NrfF